jgi:hypothetical protein
LLSFARPFLAFGSTRVIHRWHTKAEYFYGTFRRRPSAPVVVARDGPIAAVCKHRQLRVPRQSIRGGVALDFVRDFSSFNVRNTNE